MTLTTTQGAVVVGVDGSTQGDSALVWAARYAARRRRPLLVVGAAGIEPTSSQLFGSSGADFRLAAAREVVSEAVRAAVVLEPTLETEVVVPLHDPRAALLDCSTSASMVVVGIRGLGLVGRLLLGSVSQAVSAHASCPVTVVRSGHETGGTVVVATESAEGAAATLDVAFDLASSQGEPLEVVHSWFMIDGLAGTEGAEQIEQRRQDDARLLSESLAGYSEKYPDVTVNRRLTRFGPVQVMVEMSKTASVVVVGSHERTGLHRLASSVGRDVLELAHCTVVVVPS